MGARKNARAIRRHARGEGARTRTRPFFLALIYFPAPSKQASGTLSNNTILLHLIQRAQPSNIFCNLKSKTSKRRGALSSKQNLLHSSCARLLALRTRNIFLGRIKVGRWNERSALHLMCEVRRIVTSFPMNKSPGPDKISARVLKDCLPIILGPLTDIINCSILTSTFPDSWKEAEVIPILKDGDHEKAANNRPLSLLAVASKVLERIVLNQRLSHKKQPPYLTPKRQ